MKSFQSPLQRTKMWFVKKLWQVSTKLLAFLRDRYLALRSNHSGLLQPLVRPRPADSIPIVDVDFDEIRTDTSNGQTLSTDEIIRKYRLRGTVEAALHNGSTSGIEAGLKTIVAEKLFEDKYHPSVSVEQRQKIAALKQLRIEQAEKEDRQQKCKQERFETDERLIELRRDMAVARKEALIVTEQEKGVSRGTMRLYIGTIALTCLTVFVYYLTSFFLYPINWILRARNVADAGEDMNSVFTNVFNTPEAFQPGVHYLFAGFAVAFLVVGQAFLTHNNQAAKNQAKSLIIWVVLALILLADGIIAHHIQSEQIAVKEFMGLAQKGTLSPFNGEMVLSVLLGFGSALAGALLYSRYLALTNVKDHSAHAELAVTRIQADVTKLELLLTKTEAELRQLRECIEAIAKAITDLYRELSSLVRERSRVQSSSAAPFFKDLISLIIRTFHQCYLSATSKINTKIFQIALLFNPAKINAGYR